VQSAFQLVDAGGIANAGCRVLGIDVGFDSEIRPEK
jgi:hypothetical protein